MKKLFIQDNLATRILLLLICGLLLAFREFDLVLYPRMWAEEGWHFYNFALHHSWPEVLVTPQVGYLTLFNSVVSLIQANWFSIDLAPLVTTWCGFIVEMIPVTLIAFSAGHFWNSILKKYICALTVILVSPAELTLNTTNSHFVFGLITYLIMMIPTEHLPKPGRILFRFLLLLGVLTGPTSVFLAPAFLFKAFRERNRERSIQAIMVLVAGFFQAAAVIYSLMYTNNYHRLENFNAVSISDVFLVDNFSLNTRWWVYGAIILFFLSLTFIMKGKSMDVQVVMIGFIVVAILSSLGSLKMQGSPRYGYVPTCILMIFLVHQVFDPDKRFRLLAICSFAAFAFSVSVSAYRFWSEMGTVYNSDMPKWKDELVSYRKYPGYHPVIHPAYFYIVY